MPIKSKFVLLACIYIVNYAIDIKGDDAINPVGVGVCVWSLKNL